MADLGLGGRRGKRLYANARALAAVAARLRFVALWLAACGVLAVAGILFRSPPSRASTS